MSTTDDASQLARAAQREDPARPARSRGAVRAALRVALTYAVVGAAWILLSDEVVERVAGAGTARLTTIQTAKGWFFVVATAALIYFLIRGDARRIERTEHARRESDRRYQRLAEVSPDGIFVHTGGVVRYANRALAEILGVDDPRQLVGRDVLGLIHPDYHELVRARAHTMLVEGRDVPLLEERMLRADGGEVWVEVAAGPFEFDGTTGVLAVVRDVSERVASRAARARLEAERAGLLERLQLVLDRMPIACIVTDTAFRFTYWNAAAEQMFGYAFEEVKGRHPFGLITPPAVQAQVREIFRAVEEAPGPVSAVSANTTKDGRTITCAWVNSAYHDRDGRFLGIISMAQDMSESLRAQESVRRSEQMLARAQAIANLGSWELDLTSGDVKWSAEMYRIFGQDPRTLHPTREVVYQFLHRDDRDRVIAAVDAAVSHGVPLDEDHRIVRPDGVVRHVNSQGEVQRDPAGTALRMVGTLHDITERKLAEEELLRLNETLEQRVAARTAELREANEDLEAFAYTISHDLRTPLRSMRGFAQALLEDHAGELGEQGTDYARRIVAAGARMDRLTQELLEYSQLSRSQLAPQRVSLVLVLHELIGQLQRQPDFARARVEIVEPMPWVLAHRPTLAAVLSNLLENAAKFVAPGTTPLITVRAEDRVDGLARVVVQDNGIGIATEHQQRVFDVFERLHGLEQYPGTGIGLAIVRRGVERMGGRVGVESDVGQGSRFWIELPRDPLSP